MPANKLALLRYKVIDQCLQNRHRKWTLDDLIEKVSDALYEYEGISSGISKRTIQLDIQTMRSDKLGYNAPIIVQERKYYAYERANYSITNSNVSKQDVEKLQEIVKLLNQFKGFTYFEDMSALVGKLEDKIYKQTDSQAHYIEFEKNELLKGLEWIDILLEAVKSQQVLDISYQSFKARTPSPVIMHPYLLKEYRNRWFLLGVSKGKVRLMALDRIVGIEKNTSIPFKKPTLIDVPTYFDNIIGVTKTPNKKASKVILSFDRGSMPYVLTKPLHQSQIILKQDHSGGIIQIEVIPNFELEREILGFGESVEVLAPRLLKKRIERRLQQAAELYRKTE